MIFSFNLSDCDRKWDKNDFKKIIGEIYLGVSWEKKKDALSFCATPEENNIFKQCILFFKTFQGVG